MIKNYMKIAKILSSTGNTYLSYVSISFCHVKVTCRHSIFRWSIWTQYRIRSINKNGKYVMSYASHYMWKEIFSRYIYRRKALS